jgi:hypothetical protein
MPFINKVVYSDNWSGDYLAHAASMRGRILNQVAEMERVIDDYICDHFCESREKKNELMEVILSTRHVTFSSKADIVRCIVERRKDATKAQATKIFNHLDKIAKERNMVAHYSLDMSMSALKKFQADKDTIGLIKYSKIKSVEEFNKKRVIELTDISFAVQQFFKFSDSVVAKVKARRTHHQSP